jgi:tetratricopeptide (TPR) repeat protein
MDAPTLDPGQAVADIEAALAAGDRNRAIDRAIAALSAKIRLPIVLRMVAEGLEQDGRRHDALQLLNEAQSAAPDDLTLKLDFAGALFRHGAYPEVPEPLEAILARKPEDFDALMLRGKAALALDDTAGARAAFERAKATRPDRDEPLVELAAMAARRGAAEEARGFGRHALALNSGAARAAVAVARADLAEGKAADARAVLERVLAHPRIGAADRAEVLTYLGDALDALGRPSDAFAAWRQRERTLRPSRETALAAGVGEEHIHLAERLAGWVSRLPPGPWIAPPDDSETPVAGHVFLLSFPRSGATLLEQILASHPDVVALDESACLALAADQLITSDEGLERLERLTPEQAQACRDAYWEKVRDAAGEGLAGKVLIDKNPLNSVRLPIIAKLFPAATILFALRDPRDVVLSGYRRLYYSKMLEFQTLENATRFYDAVLGLTELYRDRLGLEMHTVRHEDLVADFEGQARRVLQRMGLSWNESVRDFASRPVASVTPSAAQVARGLNAEGVATWRRYVTELAAVLPLLEPWAVRFGYPAAPAPEATEPSPVATPRPAFPESPETAAAVQAAIAAVNAGRLPDAILTAETALGRGLVHPLFHRLRGVRAQQEGRLDVAIADFEAALDLAGEDAAVLNALGLCLARSGRAAEGLARLDRAIALDGAPASYHYNRGWTLETMGDLVGARVAYERCLAHERRHVPALANLAMLAARSADWPRVRALATRALGMDPESAPTLTALARAELAEGEGETARERLEGVMASPKADAHARAVASSALGDVLDELGRPDAAFAAYAEGARLLKSLYAGRFAGGESTAALARRLSDAVAKADPARWRRTARLGDANGPATHVFLLGFPRSGTTMLGQALAGHPDVVTLDERPTLTDAAQAFVYPAGGLARLAATPPEALQPYREAYWRRVRAGGAEPRGRVFVDKLPMNTLGLPLIPKLFPEARILFLRRDPRDVVLSCVRRQFIVDATTIELLDLETAANLYDAVMGLMRACRERLDLALREQGFEDLVENFEPEMRGICDFAGVDFTPAMADFAGRAGLVATPSAAQIARGLNTEGVGVWKRYRRHLEPVMGRLAPWVRDFGYAADEG